MDGMRSRAAAVLCLAAYRVPDGVIMLCVAAGAAPLLQIHATNDGTIPADGSSGYAAPTPHTHLFTHSPVALAKGEPTPRTIRSSQQVRLAFRDG